ncbi:hypothetical protein ACWEKT_35885 [Nocardia takedensis]
MTSPDGKQPAGAYTGVAGTRSIAGIAQVTEASMKNAMSTQVARSYGNISINLGAAVDSGVKRFAADLCDAITGATGGLIDLSGWAATLRAEAEEALRNSTDAHSAAQGAQDTATTQTTIIKATNSRVQVVIDGLPVKPYWETMNLTEEASFPRNLLQRAVWEASGASGSVEAKYVPNYTPAANSLEGAFIRCLYSGGRRAVSYIPDAVSSPCELYVVVGRMLDSGDVRIEWVSPNQTPEITTSRAERTVELPDELLFEQGETAFVGVHQRGSGNRRPLLGIEAVDIPRPPTVWPPQLNAQFVTSALLAAGSTLAAGSLSFASRKTPYVSLGKVSVTGDPIELTVFEDFESGVMPTSLVRMSTRAATVSGGVFVVAGMDDGLRRYLYAQRLNYDDQRVTGRVRNPTAVGARLFVRSNAGNTAYVSLTVRAAEVLLARWTAAETGVTLASLSTTIADNTAMRISAVGNVYTVERFADGAWTVLLTHTDVGNTIPTGASYRYTGLGTERSSWVDGGGWGEWRAEDL